MFSMFLVLIDPPVSVTLRLFVASAIGIEGPEGFSKGGSLLPGSMSHGFESVQEKGCDEAMQ